MGVIIKQVIRLAIIEQAIMKEVVKLAMAKAMAVEVQISINILNYCNTLALTMTTKNSFS